MNDLLLEASRWLWDYYLLATVLLTITLMVGRLIRQPVRRMALNWSSAGGLFLLAILCGVPGWSVVHMLSAPPVPQPQEVEVIEVEPGVVAFPVVPEAPITDSEIVLPPLASELPHGPTDSESYAAESVLGIDYGVLSLCLVLAGSLASLLWLAVGRWQVSRLRLSAEPASTSLQKLLSSLVPQGQSDPKLGVVEELQVAVALGLRQPMILLPKRFANESSPENLGAVLAHELAHIRHRDLWLLACLRLLMLVLWPHPLYWLWRRNVRLDQETLADAAAADLSSRAGYAEQLVNWARVAAANPAPRVAASVGLWESPSQLKRRLAVLLDEKLTLLRSCSRRWRAGAGLLVVALAVALSLFTLQPKSKTSADELDKFLENAAYESLSEVQKDQVAAAIKTIIDPTIGAHPAEAWGNAVRTLVEVGEPVVPKLIETLDEQKEDHPIRRLAFTLRAIGDNRAIPALIRAIPRTHQPPASDYGLEVDDKELGVFLKEHQTQNDGKLLTYGRALSETFRTLQRMSKGESFGEMELIFVHKQGTSAQQAMQQKQFQRVAEEWADWWENNWEDFVSDSRYAKAGLAKRETENDPGKSPAKVSFPAGPDVRLVDGSSGVIVSAHQMGQRDALLDLDTNRQARWPNHLPMFHRNADFSQEAWDWFRAEGFDLVGFLEGVEPPSLNYNAKLLDLRVWEITEQDVKDLPKSMAGEIPYPLSKEVEKLEPLHNKGGVYGDVKGKPYLFKTREGTTGLLRIYEPGGFPYPSVKGSIKYFVDERKSTAQVAPLAAPVEGFVLEVADEKSPAEKPSKFVRLVVDHERNKMTFEGRETNWEELPAMLQDVSDRETTVLEIAITSEEMRIRQLNYLRLKVGQLAKEHGFLYASDIGVHPMGSKGGDPKSDSQLADRAQPLQDTAVDEDQVSYLQELVSTQREIYKKVRALNEAGTTGGEAHNLALAGYHYAVARADLARATTPEDNAQLIEHLGEAVKFAEDNVRATEQSYEAGRVTLERLLQANTLRTKAKMELKKAIRETQQESDQGAHSEGLDWDRVFAAISEDDSDREGLSALDVGSGDARIVQAPSAANAESNAAVPGTQPVVDRTETNAAGGTVVVVEDGDVFAPVVSDAELFDIRDAASSDAPFKFAVQGRQPNTFRGQCFGADGQPAEDVMLSIYRWKRGAKPFLLNTTSSDAEGIFSLQDVLPADELPKPNQESPSYDPDAPVYMVTVQRAGAVSRVIYGSVGMIAKGQVTSMTLEPAGTLSGVVTGPDGKPVAGALVNANRKTNLPTIEGFQTARTDERGHYEITDAAPFDQEAYKKAQGQSQWLSIAAYGEASSSAESEITQPPLLRVKHPDFANKRVHYDAIPGKRDVRLKEPAKISGRVLGLDGKPAKDLRIQATAVKAFHSDAKPDPDETHVAHAKTDDNGEYRFENLPAGSYHLTIVHPQPQSATPAWLSRGVSGFSTRSGEDNRVPDIQVETGSILRLRLIDAKTDKPIEFGKDAEAQIYITRLDLPKPLEFRSIQAPCGQDEYISVRVLPGKFSLRVPFAGSGFDNSGKQPEWGTIRSEPKPLELEIEPGETLDIDIPLPRRGAVAAAQQAVQRSYVSNDRQDQLRAIEAIDAALAEGSEDDVEMETLHGARGQLLEKLGRYAEMIAAYEAMAGLKTPNQASYRHRLASHLATCPEESLRDYERAAGIAEELLATSKEVERNLSLKFSLMETRVRAYLGLGNNEAVRRGQQMLLDLLTQKIEENPTARDAVQWRYRRIAVWTDMGEYSRALAEYELLLNRMKGKVPNQVSPQSLAVTINNLAHLLATCPVDSLRDGQRAMQLAEQAIQLYGKPQPDMLDTLAAAYAEVGDFKNAVETQQRALELARPGQLQKMRQHLELYNRRKPLRLGDRLEQANKQGAAQPINPPLETGIDAKLPGRILLVAKLDEMAEREAHFPYALVSVEPNSGKWRKLEEVPPGSSWPTVSHDGKRSFYSYGDNLKRGVLLTFTDGTKPRHVCDRFGHLSCSPDGRQLIVSHRDVSDIHVELERDQQQGPTEPSDPRGDKLIIQPTPAGHWLVDVDKEKESNLDLPPEFQVEDWSPDGKSLLATVRDENEKGFHTDLVRINVDGTNRQKLTTHGGCTMPRFSNDGTQIVYCLSYKPADRNVRRSSLAILNIQTSEEHELIGFDNQLKHSRMTGQYTYYYMSCWSADDRWLAVSFEERPEPSDFAGREEGILLISRDGTQRAELTLAEGATPVFPARLHWQ